MYGDGHPLGMYMDLHMHPGYRPGDGDIIHPIGALGDRFTGTPITITGIHTGVIITERRCTECQEHMICIMAIALFPGVFMNEEAGLRVLHQHHIHGREEMLNNGTLTTSALNRVSPEVPIQEGRRSHPVNKTNPVVVENRVDHQGQEDEAKKEKQHASLFIFILQSFLICYEI